jgi:hypothetical protein
MTCYNNLQLILKNSRQALALSKKVAGSFKDRQWAGAKWNASTINNREVLKDNIELSYWRP